MIEINLNKINKSFGFNKILNDFSMDIKTGEKVALIGNNGCGKTTLFKIIVNEEIIDSGLINIRKESKIGYLKQIPPLEKDGITASEVFQRGIDYLLKMKDELDYISNNLTAHDKDIKKYSKLSEEFEINGGYLLNEKINRIKHGFKLTDELLSTEYNKLSGGEKTIINLASIILSNPDILLLDEPTNHLDIETMEWFEEYLINYKGTVLLISHDRYFLDRVITKTVCIENGHEDVYNGNYSYYLVESEKIILNNYKAYKNQQKEIKALKEAIARYRLWGEKSDNPMFFRRAHALETRLEKMEIIDKPVEKKELPISFSTIDRTGDNVLSINHYTMSIGDKLLLSDVNANIYYKDRVCFLGKNGSGKTTLIKNILNNTHNEIKMGTNIKIGFIPQEVRFENEELTIYEYIRSVFVGQETQLRSLLYQFYFGTDSLKKKIKTLSGGEKVRIKLLELTIKDVNFLILDEPTNHIDIDTRELLENSLMDFKGTILFVSHDRYFINKIATKIIAIEDKKLVTYNDSYENIHNRKQENIAVKVDKPNIIIKGSNRLNEVLKDSKITEITIGCSNKKVYNIRKKSKNMYLKVADHLSEESKRLDYLSDKIKCAEKVFYEKYNGKSYLLTKAVEGEMLCSDYYISHPLEGIDIIVEAFNALYNVQYDDCLFDETIDTKLKRIENSNKEKITDETYKKRFSTRDNMIKYLRGNKPKPVIGFTHGDMSLPNIFAKNGHFSGLVDVDECGICDIYYDIVICEISIERNYGKEYIDVFYSKLGIEKDEFKSDYYRIYQYI